MENMLKINGIWVRYTERVKVSSYEDIPEDFLSSFYYNGAFRLFTRGEYVYAIAEQDIYGNLGKG